TRQTASGLTRLACAASFCAFAFAARPMISIRSGMSRATFSALSPIEPVAPSTTTRLRFIWSLALRSQCHTKDHADRAKQIVFDRCDLGARQKITAPE